MRSNMKKSKLSILVASAMFVTFCASGAANADSANVGSNGNCANIQNAINQDAAAVGKNALAQINQNVGQPSALSGCLQSLNGLNVSIGSFDFSSLYKQLLSQACGMVNNKVQSEFGTVTSTANQYVNSKTGGLAGNVVNVGSSGSAITQQPVMTTINQGSLNGTADSAITGSAQKTMNNVFGN